MMTWKKLLGLLRNRSLKIRRKNDYSRPWKSALDSYGGTKEKKRIRWAEMLRRLRRQPAFSMGTGGGLHGGAVKAKFPASRLLKVSAALAMLCLALVLLRQPLLWAVSSLDLFQIQRIDISGNSVTDHAEIRKIAGIDYKKSMFSLSASRMAGYIEKHPWVQSASVEKVWPHGITIAIREHKAAALLVSNIGGQETIVYLNRQGEEIAPIQAGDDLDFPVITGLENLSGEAKDEAMAEAVAFLKLTAANNPNLPAQSVSEIHFDRVEGMVIRLVDYPFPIYFGRGDVAKKYRQLRDVLSVLYKKRSKGTDISNVQYIRIDYLEDKVLVAQSNSG